MSREFFRFDLTKTNGDKTSLFAGHIVRIDEVKKEKSQEVIGSSVYLSSGEKVDVIQVPEAIFKMDQWQIFKKAGANV